MTDRLWILNVFVEAVRYASGSPLSRRRQLAALRDLDARLLADVGISKGEAAAGCSAKARLRVTRDRETLPSARRLLMPERLLIR